MDWSPPERPMIRVLLILAATAAFSLPLSAGAPEVFTFVQQSCSGCHNSSVKSGGLDLKELQVAKTFEEDREVWEKVVEKIQTGKMPPPGTPEPPAATISAVTGWLQSEF